MLKLHYSNRLEGLIEPLALAIAARQGLDPLLPISIVVPNRAVEQFVKYRVAERLGVAANLRFPFLRAHLTEIAQKANPRLRVLGADALAIVIFNCLSDPACRADAALAPVRQYIDAGGSGTPEAELRCFELSARVAKLFEEYSISRGAMTGQWRANRLTASATDRAETEKWQRALWRIIFGQGRSAGKEFTGDAEHDWMLLPDAFAEIADGTLAEIAREELHVFGLAAPGQAYAGIFARLGKLGALSIYALNPCREFWEDIDTSRRNSRNGWTRRGTKLAASLDACEDPFELGAADNRALELWGRPGREYIRLLNEISECDFEPHFIDIERGASFSLLARVQADILDRTREAPADSGEPADAIGLIACPGVRREVEIVANEIWRLVEQSARGPKPLRFHEIGLLIPDCECAAYAPHIESVFARIHDIPVEISGRSLARQSRVAEAIGLLLKLPSGRFTRTEVLRLLKHPALLRAGAEVEPDLLDAWCEELGVFFGADANDLAATYIPKNLFNWDQALKRLALGVFMSGERSGDPRLFNSAATGDLLPLEIDEGEIPTAQAFVSAARALIADAQALRAGRMKLSQWRDAIARMIARYIVAEEGEDRRMRERCLAALDAMNSDGIETREVSYAVAEAMASGLIENLAGRRVSFAGRGVAAGPMGTLGSIPFRVIFVLGLGESFFPARDSRDPLDLRQTRRLPGDLSPADRDRYLFLEALLAARERIVFSWVARDPHSGDPLEPSTVIRELELILRSYLGDEAVKALTAKHPVSRYDPDYFEDLKSEQGGIRGLASFDNAARDGARMTALRNDLNQKAPAAERLAGDELQGALSGKARAALGNLLRIPSERSGADESNRDGVIDLSVSALRRFLECPAQGAARVALGMSDDEESEDEISDEPVGMSRLDQTVMLREVFWTQPEDAGAAAIEYQRAAARAQMKGRAPAGPFADALREQDLEVLRGWRKSAEAAETGDLARWREIRLGRAAEHDLAAEEPLPYLALEVPIRTPDGKTSKRQVRLHGGLGRFAPNLDAAIQCIVGKEAKPKNFLPLALNAIVLSAAGQKIPEIFSAIVLGKAEADAQGPKKTRKRKSADAGPPWIRTFKTPKENQARDYLTRLASDLLSDPHDYFFPIEAAEKFFQAPPNSGGAANLPAALEDLRDGEYTSCSSKYGPLRRWRELEIPDAASLRKLAERRFGPIKSIFGAEETGE